MATTEIEVAKQSWDTGKAIKIGFKEHARPKYNKFVLHPFGQKGKRTIVGHEAVRRQASNKLMLPNLGFGCKKTDKWQRNLDNNMTLLFGRYTQVTFIEDNGFPLHYFNFASYNEVGHRADARDSILTDYIGIICNIGNIREFGDTTTNRISRRTIEIQNLNGNSITFTLWNEIATRFEINTCMDIEQPVIIAVSSCWAKWYAEFIGPTPPLMLPSSEPQNTERERSHAIKRANGNES
ncbi:nucleic acid-binding, OB-fold protein [Artemisia annua]|uniref:Nucleic acid-binding, OB-fold protein n=1 Tax=Artemisia annua TaxID=35608 RepID=A0A2U1LKP3_ARTAN|nr:nucleic acid-binding, OB-fold protein [Artemisia annua]